MLQRRSADQLSSAGSPEPRCCSRQSLQDEVEDVATSCHLAQHFLHQPSINSQATAVAIDNSDYEPKTALLASAHPAAKPHYHDLLHAVLAVARSPTTRDCQRRPKDSRSMLILLVHVHALEGFHMLNGSTFYRPEPL